MRRLIRVKEVLWVLAMFGLVAIIARMFQGLGAVTALSDALPWGLWKIGNMVAGVALGTCGFVMAAVVVAFKKKRFEPLLRPAIVIAFLGYGSSAFSLFLDIGLPWRIWQPMVYWNIHSFLFEVAMCVMFYFSVTTFETFTIVSEKWWHKLAHFLHRISIPIIFLGITLSTMHHASLGSLFLVSPTRIHELWMSPWIWGLFITSAMASGLFTLVFVDLGFCYLYKRKPDVPLLASVAKGGSFMLIIYAVLQLADMAHRDLWPVVFSGQWEGVVFIIENLIQVVIPLFLMLIPAVRKSAKGLATAAAFAMVGLVMHRIDVGVVAFFRDAGAVYFPTLPEIFVTLGVYAAAGLVFLWLAENFEVFEKPPVRPIEDDEEKAARFDPVSNVWEGALLDPVYRFSGVIVVSICVAIALFSSSLFGGTRLLSVEVQPPTSQDPSREILTINGNRNNVAVNFKHDWHKEFLGGDESCVKCHHIDKPNDRDTACWKCHTNMRRENKIFDHTYHMSQLGGNASCPECHEQGKPRWRDNTKKCYACHKENMRMPKSTRR